MFGKWEYVFFCNTKCVGPISYTVFKYLFCSVHRENFTEYEVDTNRNRRVYIRQSSDDQAM